MPVAYTTGITSIIPASRSGVAINFNIIYNTPAVVLQSQLEIGATIKYPETRGLEFLVWLFFSLPLSTGLFILPKCIPENIYFRTFREQIIYFNVTKTQVSSVIGGLRTHGVLGSDTNNAWKLPVHLA